MRRGRGAKHPRYFKSDFGSCMSYRHHVWLNSCFRCFGRAATGEHRASCLSWDPKHRRCSQECLLPWRWGFDNRNDYGPSASGQDAGVHECMRDGKRRSRTAGPDGSSCSCHAPRGVQKCHCDYVVSTFVIGDTLRDLSFQFPGLSPMSMVP
jgi:hypothetical protein